jgi:hypothetical protein
MIIERNEDEERNFYIEIIKECPKDTQKKILNKVIIKLKEDIEESKAYFHSESIIQEIENKYKSNQGVISLLPDINSSSNENPLSKGTFISSIENQRSSDIYMNEINSNHDNNYNLNDNLNNNRVGVSDGNTICDTMIVEEKDDEIIDELLYSFKNFSNEKNDEQKKLYIFEFIDYVLLDKE